MYDIVTIIVVLFGIGIIILSFYKDNKSQIITKKSMKENNIDYYEEYGARIEELNKKILELNEYGTFLKSELDKKHKELLFLYQIIHEKTKEINGANDLFNQEDNDKVLDDNFYNNSSEINVQSKKINKQIEQETEQAKTIMEQQKFNNNKMILQLSERGYSITDIAQILNIGQGEVKLVLDLFE